MVCNHTHAYVVFYRRTVCLSRELCSEIQNRANLINLIKVFNTLHQESYALKTHTGVDVLLWKLSKNFEVVFAGALTALVLHEN